MVTYPSILAWRIHGQRSLVGPSPWGHKELDRIERLTLSPLVIYILSSSFPPQCLIYQSHFPGICLVSLTENNIPFLLSVYSSLLSFTSQRSVLKILNIQQMLAE